MEIKLVLKWVIGNNREFHVYYQNGDGGGVIFLETYKTYDDAKAGMARHYKRLHRNLRQRMKRQMAAKKISLDNIIRIREDATLVQTRVLNESEKNELRRQQTGDTRRL